MNEPIRMNELMLNLYWERLKRQKPTDDTVTDKLLLTQRCSSRHHQRHGTHTRNRDTLCDIDIFFSDIQTGNQHLQKGKVQAPSSSRGYVQAPSPSRG
jgi:hypothetical protein